MMDTSCVITVTRKTYNLLIDKAIFPYDNSNDQFNKDGTVTLLVSEETYNRLEKISSDTEKAILTILRMPLIR